MRLPALWIVTAFAAGIGVASRWPVAVPWCAALAAATILAGSLSVWRQRTPVAWTFALCAWMALGGLATGIERDSVPKNHITRLLAASRIETAEPMRWQGRLREDPLRMPWGRRYEINLESVELGGATVDTSGGLRVNLYNGPQAEGAPKGLRAGDRVEALVNGRPPRNFLDPGAFDLHGYLARQKIDLVGSLRSGELLRLVDRPPPTILQRLARARGDLLVRLQALFPGQPGRAALLRAMLLGDRTFVDSEVASTFQKTAAYHVLVVAGLHVGALAVALFWLGRRLRFPLGANCLITLLVLAAYIGVVQNRPPILRASLMAALYLCARPLFRRVDLLNTVAAAAIAILLWRPSSLYDSSFQLSFLAAGVIAGLAIPWMERSSAPHRAGLAHLGDVTRDMMHPPRIARFRIEMRWAAQWLAARWPQISVSRAALLLAGPVRVGLRLWEIVLLSVVIQWGMMPLLARDFHRVSLAGPLSNIPAVILTGLIVPLGFLTLAMTFLWSRIALILAKALGLCVAALLGIVEWIGRWPHVSYRIPGPPLWLLILFFAALICLAAEARMAAARRAGWRERRKMPAPVRPAEWLSALALAGLTLLVAWHPFAPSLERGKLEVDVLDVGQGDSIFAAFPDGRTLLVDGGGQPGSRWEGEYRTGMDIGEQVVSPYLWSRGLKRLDVVALTHAHHDHIDGLRSVLENFKVEELWLGRDEHSPAFENLLVEARSLGVRIVHQTRGNTIQWGGAEIETLWPLDSSAVTGAANEDSLTLRIGDGPVRFLLTGDIEKREEAALVQTETPLAADFLKVPHHGSKTSSSAGFVAAVAPKVAVFSVGEANPFGHPAGAVIERYEQAGVRLLRTDRDGAVSAITDGRSLLVHSYAEANPLQ